jgi:hypothetical protein
VQNGDDARVGADQQLSRTVTRFQAQRRADRRIFAYADCMDRSVVSAQITLICTTADLS